MKKLITSLFLIFSLTTYSQVTEKDDVVYKRDVTFNELSIGALNLVAFGALDLAYERILSPNTGLSGEIFILALGRDNEDLADAFSKDFSFTSKYKYYFGDRSAWGFYVNGMAMVSSGDYDETISAPDPQPVVKEYTDLALGFGLGGKFVARQGFFVDLGVGIGRNLLNKNSPTIVGQFNANMGVRF